MKMRKKKEILIELKNVSFDYKTNNGTIAAIENINLEIKKGEFLCLLGPSGCGKSTLLKIIAGYLKPTRGLCLMNGKPITGPHWSRGVVFQSPTLYPWMSIKKNIEFGPRMRGFSKKEIEKIVKHYLKQIQLEGYEDKAVFELSGGMKQRVEVARTLANKPEVILMDEPFGALDALTRMNMQTFIRQIWHDNNNTIFMITHDIDEALSLGTRVLVMSKSPGKMLKEFNINFTYEALNNNQTRIKIGEEYMNIKEMILDLINQQ